jgi:hypothetical protein
LTISFGGSFLIKDHDKIVAGEAKLVETRAAKIVCRHIIFASPRETRLTSSSQQTFPRRRLAVEVEDCALIFAQYGQERRSIGDPDPDAKIRRGQASSAKAVTPFRGIAFTAVNFAIDGRLVQIKSACSRTYRKIGTHVRSIFCPAAAAGDRFTSPSGFLKRFFYEKLGGLFIKRQSSAFVEQGQPG